MFTFTHEQFSGPLDALLQMIEERELDITQVSLSKITDEYLQYVNAMSVMNESEIADFLVIAAKLLYLKSKALLPSFLPEDESVEDLARQLKMYERFVRASAEVQRILSEKNFMFGRDPMIVRKNGFQPPPRLNAIALHEIFVLLLQRMRGQRALPEVTVEKVVSLRERIEEVQRALANIKKTKFHDLLSDPKSKSDIVVTFLALLELVKQRAVSLEQNQPFSHIHIQSHL